MSGSGSGSGCGRVVVVVVAVAVAALMAAEQDWAGRGTGRQAACAHAALPCPALCAQCRVAHITLLPTTACLPPAPPAESLAKAALEAEDLDD